MSVSYIKSRSGVRLAYVHNKPTEAGKALPIIMFLGGFKSNMFGTKALYLEGKCAERGQEFVRFDYSGHGKSDGEFIDGTIGSWKDDAWDIIDYVISRDVILVGSSMGGWIALLLLMSKQEHIKGMVGIACAPDFTRDIEAQMSDDDRDMVEQFGRLKITSDYGEPYIFTKALLKDGAVNSILGHKYDVNVPITLVQGKQDFDVPWKKALQIKKCFPYSKVEIVFVEDGNHRLSRTQDLELINKCIKFM